MTSLLKNLLSALGHKRTLIIPPVQPCSMGLDDFVRALLVSNGLGYVVVVPFQRHRRNHDRGFEPFELAGATGELAIIRRARKKVTLLKDLIALIVSIGTEPVHFHIVD